MTDSETSFWDHLEGLRRTLLQSIAIIALGSLLAFVFYQDVLTFLSAPSAAVLEHEIRGSTRKTVWKKYRVENLEQQEVRVFVPDSAIELSQARSTDGTVTLATGETLSYELPSSPQLVLFSPTEGMFVAFRVSLWVGLVLTSPLWLLLLLRFAAPGLLPSEQRLLVPFLLLSCCFIALGIAFAFKFTVPLANRFLFHFNASLGQNLWSLSHYTSFTLVLLLGNGLAFELLVVLLFLVHLNYVSAETLAKKRRHAVLAIAILSAILTPPDVVTQMLLGVPLVGLYELTILYARLKRARHTGLVASSD